MSEKWSDWHQEPEPGETWDFRRYESDPAIDALAEQMGVHPEDVTPETILGYVEEVRAAGVAPRTTRRTAFDPPRPPPRRSTSARQRSATASFRRRRWRSRRSF